MTKKDMKTALKGSMRMEEKSVIERFEKADTLFSVKEKLPTELKSESEQQKIPSAGREEQLKVVRDSFTMPQEDYELITLLKKRSLNSGIEITKSEILRAGLKALKEMQEEEFLSKLSLVEKIKTGRRKQVTKLG